MMTRAIALIVLVLIGSTGRIWAAEEGYKAQIEGPGMYLVRGHTLRGEAISVTIMVSANSPTNPYSKYLGTGEGTASTLITDLKIERAGKLLFIPLSAYIDLSAPHEASLQIGSRVPRLVVTGGDASESYRVVWTLGTDTVSFREVFSLLDPSKPTQKSFYWLRELKDE